VLADRFEKGHAIEGDGRPPSAAALGRCLVLDPWTFSRDFGDNVVPIQSTDHAPGGVGHVANVCSLNLPTPINPPLNFHIFGVAHTLFVIRQIRASWTSYENFQTLLPFFRAFLHPFKPLQGHGLVALVMEIRELVDLRFE